MSWDKNTVNMSKIDDLVGMLEDHGLTYVVSILANIPGMGINDLEFSEDGSFCSKIYELKKLVTDKSIYVDQMLRHPDCDADDVIVTHKYEKGEFPVNFAPVVDIEEEGYL